MAKDAQTAVDEISDYIQEKDSSYSEWYCGIATKVKERLLDGHNVPVSGSPWIAVPCTDSDNARAAEKILLDRGCEGSGGGGDAYSRFIYAYLITPTTRQ